MCQRGKAAGFSRGVGETKHKAQNQKEVHTATVDRQKNHKSLFLDLKWHELAYFFDFMILYLFYFCATIPEEIRKANT